MSRSALSAVGLLRALAQKLPDAILNQYFPERSPTEIRACLQAAATALPETETIEGKKHAIAPEGQASACSGDLPASILLYTDGASRGNPGEAGAGISITDENGQELASGSWYLGTCTNNVAEYRALALGLEEALKLGAQAITVLMDSELIVRQLAGRYKVKSEDLKPLYATVVKLLKQFRTFSVRHVPRHRNARADELANRGIDNR